MVVTVACARPHSPSTLRPVDMSAFGMTGGTDLPVLRRAEASSLSGGGAEVRSAMWRSVLIFNNSRSTSVSSASALVRA